MTTHLRAVRERIADLAVESGPYCVVCGRTGERFVPVAGLRFPDRPRAAVAARLAERYRAVLREHDPGLPCYDPVACETPLFGRAGLRTTGGSATASAEGAPPSTLADHCHAVAAALFTELSERGHDGVETAVMDAYRTRAGSVADPDRLCVELLRSLALALDDRLPSGERTRLLDAAARRLPTAAGEDDPLRAAAVRLEAVSVISSFRLNTDSDGTRSMTLTRYVMDAGPGRLPTLPLGVELLRRHPGPVAVTGATALGRDRLRLDLDPDGAPGGLTTVTAGQP